MSGERPSSERNQKLGHLPFCCPFTFFPSVPHSEPPACYMPPWRNKKGQEPGSCQEIIIIAVCPYAGVRAGAVVVGASSPVNLESCPGFPHQRAGVTDGRRFGEDVEWWTGSSTALTGNCWICKAVLPAVYSLQKSMWIGFRWTWSKSLFSHCTLCVFSKLFRFPDSFLFIYKVEDNKITLLGFVLWN